MYLNVSHRYTLRPTLFFRCLYKKCILIKMYFDKMCNMYEYILSI